MKKIFDEKKQKLPILCWAKNIEESAMEQAINLALKLVSYKKVKVVYLPDEKDCNDLGRKKVFRYICSTHYQDYNDLMQLKNEL